MTEPFVAQIQVFGFNFAPRGWAACNGATMAIQQNTALFALLGTQYGGNGQTTFQLPNFVNRAAANQGSGAGLTPRNVGEAFGVNSVTLTSNQMPAHSHTLNVYNQPTDAKKAASPSNGNALGSPSMNAFVASNAANAPLAPTVLQPAGGGQPHENRQPYLAMNFCIALQGVFPAFN